MKLSDIYGKRVLSTAGKSGYVLGVYADKNKIECLICADEDENEFTVDFKNIKSIKDKILFKEGGSEIKGTKLLKLGIPVYDCEGELFGKLTDLTFTKNTLTQAHVGSKKFSLCDIVLGDIVIIKNTARIVKSDVKSGGRVIIKKGTPLSEQLLKKACKKGEYVQTNLKTI